MQVSLPRSKICLVGSFMLKIGILGILGRMGQTLVQSIEQNPRTELAGGTILQGYQHNLTCFVTENPKELAEKSDILIDFTTANALESHLSVALETKTPIVIGTTGFGAQTKKMMHHASQEIPILQSGNMSLGVNILSKLVQQTASILDSDWDIEITEAHHRHKVDSPSGTATMLGEAAAEGRKIDYHKHKKLSREGIETPRALNEIGFSTIRGGSIVGEHSVLFAHDNEMITLSHRAQDRMIFANGAVYAAEKISFLSSGFYTMQDILVL